MIALLLAVALDCDQFAKYKPPAVPKDAHNVEFAEKYANGDGVKRNLDAAAYFLCKAEEEMAPMEFSGMSQHLAAMRAGTETKPLDFCDYVTSGYGMGFCAHREYEQLMPELDRRLAALHVPDALVAKGLAYVKAETERTGELSRGGTGYAGFVLGEEMSEKQSFVVNLERRSARRAPIVTEAQAKAADDELNAAYRAWDRDTFLRDAQRAWIAYRDAFALWYAERWKGKASSFELRREIVTELSRERALDLREGQ
jgi:uncharacterized protein YecT (DUF1311 family)